MRRLKDESLREFVERLITTLRGQARNAALRGKPTMWAYYLRMEAEVIRVYSPALERNEDAIIEAARSVEQQARRMCLLSTESGPGDKALWYACSVYARMILRAAGEHERGWIGWLKDEGRKM